MTGPGELYRNVSKHLPYYLFVFPLTAGLTWFTTLSVLLVYWILIGRPTFPGQSNPYVSFISDIAAYHLKAFFIAGCTITSITLIGTIFSLHYARNSSEFYAFPGSQSGWRRTLSTITLLAAIVAGVSLFLLALFDTVHEHEKHQFLLLSTFGGLGITTVGTSLVWSDAWLIGRSRTRRERIGGTKDRGKLRHWCAINLGLMVLIIALSVMFIAFVYLRWMRTAGVIEWIVAYAGAFWLLSFVKVLRRAKAEESYPDDEEDNVNNVNDVDERTSLISGVFSDSDRE